MAGRLFVTSCILVVAIGASDAATVTVNSTIDKPEGLAGDRTCETVPSNGICTLCRSSTQAFLGIRAALGRKDCSCKTATSR